MKDLAGRTAILTGANGGLGTYLAGALADAGMNLVLVAYPGNGLDEIVRHAEQRGVKSVSLVADLRVGAQREQVVALACAAFGGTDLLVNNAGVEYSAVFHELPEANVREVLNVNLEAPMMLTHRVLPGMLERRRGHVVNISSLAGKSGPGYQEPYAASKAGLVAFTSSLRATYRGTGVSASVVCPGFVETGIYARITARTGRRAPTLLAPCAPERVTRAVLRAVRRDQPEVIVSRYPVLPLLVLTTLSPRLGAWVTARIGTHDFFRAVVEAEKRK